jgi:predicted nucleotidyltransferase
MTTGDDVIYTLQAHQNELAAIYGVRTLALFGSVARNEATNQSDVDLLADLGCKEPDLLVGDPAAAIRQMRQRTTLKCGGITAV